MIGRFFRNASVIAAAELVARMKSLILLPILARHFEQAEFGTWSQVTVLTLTVFPLIALGTDSGVIRLLPGREIESQNRLFMGWYTYLLGAATLAALVMVLLRRPLSLAFFGAETQYLPFMWLGAASLVATALVFSGRTWLLIRGDARGFVGVTLAQAGLNVIVVLAIVMSGGSVFLVIAATVATDAIVGLGITLRMIAKGAFRKPDFALLGPALKFGLPLLPSAYAMWALNWMDRLFLVHYRTMAELGMYSVAYSAGYALVQVMVNPLWAMYPSAAAALHNSGDRPGAARLMRVTVGVLIAIGLPAVAGLWVLDAPILRLVAGARYDLGALVMPLVALAYLFSMMASFADFSLGLAYRQYFAAASIVCGAVVNLGLNFMLIPMFGIVGAALATVTAFGVQCLVSSCLAARVADFRVEFAFPAKIATGAVGLAVVLAPLSAAMTSDIERLLLLIPAGAAIFAVIEIALGADPWSIRNLIWVRIGQLLRL